MRFTPVCLGFFGLIALGSAESEQVSLGSSVETTTNTLTKRTFCLPFIGCYGSVDTTTDDQNCGNSKINCQKLSYPNGANGICENSVCGPSSCNAGFSLNPNTRTCQQINTASDVNNCGSFGNKCSPFANAQGVQCLAGRCAPLTPNPGYAFDPASRQCLSVNNDLNNCGRLGNVCSFPRGYGTCNSGVCTLQGCNTGSYNIGGQCTAISVQSDVKNCGAPGKICSFPNAQASCVNGQCQQGDCLDGYSATSVVTGYTLFVFPQYSTQCSKINFQTDPQNCGGAGVQCAASYVNGGAGQCVNGQCTASCDSGHDWDPLGFFCRPVTADVNNCGRCGQKCSFPNGSSQCVNGQCSLTSCNPGFNKINGQCVSLNLQSDVNNCGAQGKICAFANGGGVCANGQCTTTTCAQNFQLLAGKCVPMNLQSDVKNCGAVGASCPSTIGSPVCNSGNCGYSSCNSPYTFKDGQCNPVNMQTDPQNCGSLNKVCPNKADGSQAQCVAGQCQLNCAPGTTYDPRDNFCRPTTSDPGNCGGIGIFCDTLAGAYSASCINSVCTATRCYDDYVLVKGQCQQVNVNTDVNNCGTKGRVCPTFANGASSICDAGICKPGACNPGFVWDGQQCVARNASQRPKPVKRSLATEKKTLCPKDETACPILGSATYEQALNHHFSDMNKFSSGIMAGEGGYECLDTQQSLESCGGCASTGEGKDCTAIPAALGVGCDAGTCVVFSCKSGYRPSLDGQKCIKATHLTKRNYNHTSSKTLPRRHSHNSRALPLNHGK